MGVTCPLSHSDHTATATHTPAMAAMAMAAMAAMAMAATHTPATPAGTLLLRILRTLLLSIVGPSMAMDTHMARTMVDMAAMAVCMEAAVGTGAMDMAVAMDMATLIKL